LKFFSLLLVVVVMFNMNPIGSAQSESR